jgi:hypothetical protein
VILLTCLLWLSAAALTWLVLMRQAARPEPAPAPAPPDPIRAEVERWMHQWDRGRA